jgi:hypothetical protein
VSIGSGGIAAEDLVAALVAGRGDGSWNGTTGIRSSVVDGESQAGMFRTVGWADQGDGSILVGYAAAGDATMDGMIDILDIGEMLAARAFNSGLPANWRQGDFNYDGVCDALDVADLMVTGLLDAGDYRVSVAGGMAPLVAVPEPGLTGMGLAGAVGSWSLARCLRRRRLDGRGGAEDSWHGPDR